MSWQGFMVEGRTIFHIVDSWRGDMISAARFDPRCGEVRVDDTDLQICDDGTVRCGRCVALEEKMA